MSEWIPNTRKAAKPATASAISVQPTSGRGGAWVSSTLASTTPAANSNIIGLANSGNR